MYVRIYVLLVVFTYLFCNSMFVHSYVNNKVYALNVVLLFIQHRPKRPDMDRQTSTSRLVSSDLEDSQTSLELKTGLRNGGSTTVVRKPSQVCPVSENLENQNDVVSSSPDSAYKSDKSSCGRTAGKIITSALIGMYFGWFLQKSTGKSCHMSIKSLQRFT